MLLLQDEHLFLLDILLPLELLPLFERLRVNHADVLGHVVEILNQLGSLIVNLRVLRVFTNRLNLHLIILEVLRDVRGERLVAEGLAIPHLEVYVREPERLVEDV